jgi:RNA polymerase sigma factor (sigma-70 family)
MLDQYSYEPRQAPGDTRRSTQQAAVADAVRAAAAGDSNAWMTLVELLTPSLWAIARAHRLHSSDAADVVQVAWLRLVEHIGHIREPEHVGAWLATTVRRESWRLLRRKGAEHATSAEDLEGLSPPDVSPGPDFGLLRAESHARLQQAVRQLPPRQQLLIRLLAAPSPPSYEEISAATGIPVGSIGPTRGRALKRLRALLAADDLAGEDTARTSDDLEDKS